MSSSGVLLASKDAEAEPEAEPQAEPEAEQLPLDVGTDVRARWGKGKGTLYNAVVVAVNHDRNSSKKPVKVQFEKDRTFAWLPLRNVTRVTSEVIGHFEVQ